MSQPRDDRQDDLFRTSLVSRAMENCPLSVTSADSDEVARVYRYEVARGFRDDVAHLSDLISPGGEAF